MRQLSESLSYNTEIYYTGQKNDNSFSTTANFINNVCDCKFISNIKVFPKTKIFYNTTYILNAHSFLS